MIIFHLFSIFILLPIPFFLVKLANGLLINGLWLSCCLSPELCHLCFIFLLNISMISLCFKTCGKMFYCNSQMLCSNIFWIMLLISPILLFISLPPSWCSIMRMNSLLIHFLFFICETMHFSRSRSCWRPPCERHQGSFQVWKFPFPSLLHLPPSSPPCLSPSLSSYLPASLPSSPTCTGSDSFLQIWFVCLICYLALPLLFFGTKGMILLQIYVCCVSCFWQVTSVLYLNISANFMCQLDSAMRCQGIWSNIICGVSVDIFGWD